MPKNSIESQLNLVLQGVDHQLLPVQSKPLRIYAQNVDGLPSIMMRLTPTCSVPDFVYGTQGIRVQIDKAKTTGYYSLSLQSKTKTMNGAFYALAFDLVELSLQKDTEQEAFDAILNRFEEFRKLMQLERKGLSEEETRGLLAEINILKMLIEKKGLSPEQVLLSWHGPYLGNKDIVSGNSALEVKSLRQNATSIQISSPDQLDSNGLKLYLVCEYLEKVTDPEAKEATTLRDAIDGFYNLLGDDFSLKKQFEAAINQTGYNENDSEYPDWLFITRQRRFYNVYTDFPRLRAQDFPRGVKDVKFSLVISELEDYAIDLDEVEIGNN